MQEEKGSILPDRPANPSAVAVIPPLGIFREWLPGKSVGAVASEPVVGVQLVILMTRNSSKLSTGVGTTARGVAWKPVL